VVEIGQPLPHMYPIDLAAVDGVSDPIHRVADDSVAGLHAGRLQRFDQ
jgi:hypothetical protein